MGNQTEHEDRYERIRLALNMGPTAGPWGDWNGNVWAGPFKKTPMGITGYRSCICELSDGAEGDADGEYIAACDPDTIRSLLAERDALLAAMRYVHETPPGEYDSAVGCRIALDALNLVARGAK